MTTLVVENPSPDELLRAIDHLSPSQLRPFLSEVLARTARRLSSDSEAREIADHRAEAYVQAIGSLLENEQPRAAKEMAALAVELFSDHPELEKMNRVLNPRKVAVSSYRGPDRTREFDWLRRHRQAYHGQWVALVGDELIAASRDVQDVIREIHSRDLDDHPLIHRVD